MLTSVPYPGEPVQVPDDEFTGRLRGLDRRQPADAMTFLAFWNASAFTAVPPLRPTPAGPPDPVPAPAPARRAAQPPLPDRKPLVPAPRSPLGAGTGGVVSRVTSR